MRTKNCPKQNLDKRWMLPDRVFFACGACHVLAFVFLQRYKLSKSKPIWIKPDTGHTGNHIFISSAQMVFDYHGYSDRQTYLAHYWKRAKQMFPQWDASLVEISPEALIAEGDSVYHQGLWLRSPGQFYKNPIPRAETFLSKFSQPPSSFQG